MFHYQSNSDTNELNITNDSSCRLVFNKNIVKNMEQIIEQKSQLTNYIQKNDRLTNNFYIKIIQNTMKRRKI